MVPRHVVSLRGDKGWPVWSPYFEHKWHLFLRSHLKEKVFKNYPHTLSELRDRNIEEVNSIPRYICNGAIQMFWKHLQQNVDTDRHHSGDITFQTSFNIFPFSYYSSEKLRSPFCRTRYDIINFLEFELRSKHFRKPFRHPHSLVGTLNL